VTCKSRCMIKDNTPSYKFFIPMHKPQDLVTDKFLSHIKIESDDRLRMIQEKQEVLTYFSKRNYNNVPIWSPHYMKGQLFRSFIALYPALHLILITDGFMIVPCLFYIFIYMYSLLNTWNEIKMHKR
jgi:hypothetical protein